jgi:hypothetical protein
MANPQYPNVTGIFLTGSDFKGRYAIATSQSSEIILQSIIDEWERKTIMKLFGVELGKLLIAYHEAHPSSDFDQRFEDLIAPFDLQTKQVLSSNDWCHCERDYDIHSSLGLVDFLTAVVYFYYISDDQIKNSQSGMVVANVETAGVLSPREAQRVGESKYNKALQTSDAIQWFCHWKKDDTTGDKVYPEYQGLKFQPQYGSVL